MTSQQPEAWLAEIFCSIQGEGPLVGTRQVFVRLAGCHRRCRFCDTPAALLQKPAAFTIQSASGTDRKEANPVTASRFSNLLQTYRTGKVKPHSLSFTGGEPLLQAEFLRAALPRLRRAGWHIHLETSGDRWRELSGVLPQLEFIAMDIKLPSVTGQPGTWQAHKKFLTLAVKSRAETFVKIVVSRTTSESEVRRAARLVAAIEPQTPVILQPATAHAGVRAPTPEQLWYWQALALASGLRDVRVIPQVHVLMGQ
ncbi:MAG: 7-carboxy-7-deazaguanine synthase QueE, partial [Kiritimatiellaeota bacterium]|nr:7-carboxy-7-deazaguanine synthase QueE [Kiritimatiellota bacterium]